MTRVEALQRTLCIAALHEAETLGTATPEGSRVEHESGALKLELESDNNRDSARGVDIDAISRLGVDSVCPMPIRELRDALQCASSEPVVRRNSDSWSSSALGRKFEAMDEAARVAHINSVLINASSGVNSVWEEVDLFVIDTKSRLWSIGDELKWQKLGE